MKKLIFEDQTIHNVQRQMMGMKNQSDPQANTVSTLLGANNRDDNSQAPIVKPYPLGLSDDILSKMYVEMLNFKKMIGNGLENPALKNRYKPLLRDVNEKCDIINEILVEISQDMDKIV